MDAVLGEAAPEGSLSPPRGLALAPTQLGAPLDLAGHLGVGATPLQPLTDTPPAAVRASDALVMVRRPTPDAFTVETVTRNTTSAVGARPGMADTAPLDPGGSAPARSESARRPRASAAVGTGAALRPP